MPDIQKLQKAIAQENLEGWLFFNFHHRDALSDQFLEIPPQGMNTRSWYYFVPVQGNPLGICHAIEPVTLEHLPGEKLFYSGRDDLKRILAPLACRCGVPFSRNITGLSCLDHGTALFLEEMGFTLCPAEGLIQRALGILSPQDMESHEEAAELLYGIIHKTWNRIRDAFSAGAGGELREKEVQDWILADFRENGLVTEHSPVVAAGPNSGNPHYEPGRDSRVLRAGEIIQFDIWAKRPGGIFADISWVGFLGTEPGPRERERFDLVRAARDLALTSIREGLARGENLRGRDIDLRVREFLMSRGMEKLVLHRTGHGIDRELHGWGVNLDCCEFPDERSLLEGSCFSIEPGLYDGGFGCRTEIDVYIKNGHAVVSGGGFSGKTAGGSRAQDDSRKTDGHIQKTLLTF